MANFACPDGCKAEGLPLVYSPAAFPRQYYGGSLGVMSDAQGVACNTWENGTQGVPVALQEALTAGDTMPLCAMCGTEAVRVLLVSTSPAPASTSTSPASTSPALPDLPQKLPHLFTAEEARLLIVEGVRKRYDVAVSLEDVEFQYGYDSIHEETDFDGVKVLLPFALKTERS